MGILSVSTAALRAARGNRDRRGPGASQEIANAAGRSVALAAQGGCTGAHPEYTTHCGSRCRATRAPDAAELKVSRARLGDRGAACAVIGGANVVRLGLSAARPRHFRNQDQPPVPRRSS